MNLLHLEQFYEVARAGSVSTGARKLRLSQPALSKSIKLLEADLGTKLFTRSKRGMFLTTAGKLAFEHAGRIFSEARSLADEIRTEENVLSGDWCLGASDNLAIHVLPKFVAGMKADHPALRIQLYSGTSAAIKDELLADRCDAGLFYTPPTSSEGFRFEKVAETEFWIVLGAQSPWGKRKKKWSLADLRTSDIPRIESRHKDYAGGFPAHFHSQKLDLPGAPYLEANLHEVKKQLVLAGAGYSFLVKHAVDRDVSRGRLLRVSTPEPLLAPIYWVTRKGRVPNRASVDFLERILRAKL